MSAPPPPVSATTLTVGNTPVVKLQKVVPPHSADVFVKLEYFNPTGSYKDRMALAMIEEAEKRGTLLPGMTVVEYTGGSTGSSLAFVCATKGYTFHVVSSDAFAEEKLRTMQAFGADLEILPSDTGQITPDLIPRMKKQAEKIVARGNAYFTDQLNNRDTLVGYAGIGCELAAQMDRPIDIFCGGIGTAGMLMGVAAVLKQQEPPARIIALEPATSAVLSGGEPGAHHIEGIGLGFKVPHMDESFYDDSLAIEEDEARTMARRLAQEEGIFVGTSSGLNVAAAVQLAQALGPGHIVATVAVDTGLKYLAGNLFA